MEKNILLVEMVRLKKYKSLKEAAEHDKNCLLTLKNGKYELNDLDLQRKVTAALNIAKAESCTIVVCSNEDKVIINIEKSNSDWESMCVKIDKFFELYVRYLVYKNIKIN